MRAWRPVLAGVGLFLLAGCGSEGATVGAVAPDFPMEAVASGKEARLADLKGKVVVLDFWATWCGPCRKAMPHIDRVVRNYRDQGVVSAAVSDEDTGQIKSFAKAMNYDLTFYRDPFGMGQRKFNVTGIPATFVIGRDGKILYAGTPPDPAELEQAVQTAVKG